MFKKFLISALLVFSMQAFADVADTVHNSSLADHEATLNQKQKAVSMQSSPVEAMFGCNIAQAARIKLFFHEDSQYECVETNNIYNSGLNKIFLIVLSIISAITVPLIMYIIPHIGKAFHIAKMTGYEENKDQASMMVLILASLGVLLVPLIPTKTTNQTGFESFDYNNKMNLYTFIMTAGYSVVQNGSEYYYFKQSQLRQTPYASVNLLNPKNKGYQQALNAIQFGSCISTVQASDEIDVNVYYNEQTSSYRATKQLDGCLLDISASIDPSLIAIGKAAGVDYKAVTDKTFESYLNTIFSRGVAVGTAIAKRGEPLPNTDATTFDAANLERGNEASYNLAGLDQGAISDYSDASARLIGEDATWIAARYPGVEMPTASMTRSVQLCSNVQGGTSYFDSSMTVNENLKNCVQTMCAESSSTTTCGQALGYYNYLANDNALKNPNMVTFINKFFKEYYQTNSWTLNSHLFLDSLSVETLMNNTESASYDDRTGDLAFTIKVKHGFTNYNVDWINDAPINKLSTFDYSGNFENTLMKMFTHDSDGIFGLDYFFDCLAHPNDANRPNGRFCSNVTNTIARTGQNLTTLGLTTWTGLKLNSLMNRNPAQKTLQTAAVRTTVKDVLDGTSGFGVPVFLAKLTGTFLAKEAIEDNFSPYGANLTNEDVALLAVAYANPQFEMFVQGIAVALLGIGFLMMTAIPFIVVLGFLAIHILYIFIIFSSITLIGAFFSALRHGNIHDEINFYSPLGLLAVSVLGAFTYPILITFSLRFIDTLAVYQVVDYSSMMTLNGKTPQITDFSSIFTYLIGATVYVLFLLQLYGNLIKLSTKSVFVRIILLGESRDDKVYKEIELSTNKTLI
ncbi:hypothetical protein G7017_03715 [Pseudomonas fulva]|uniref:hypothetical protein n=1 Tax=Pseudomonas fulva TaxID=47880 RepID=UPI0015E29E0D|nr:hypothetical protein [Pseudomonas fulva]MBA1220010.1 hypothetical protein [Pseudomonas fulva]